jgi:hypothetical protein
LDTVKLSSQHTCKAAARGNNRCAVFKRPENLFMHVLS